MKKIVSSVVVALLCHVVCAQPLFTWSPMEECYKDTLFGPDELYERSLLAERPLVSGTGAGASYKGPLNSFGRGVAIDSIRQLCIGAGYSYQTSPTASSASTNVVTNQTTYAMIALQRFDLLTGAPDTTFNLQGHFGIRKVPGQVVTDLGYPSYVMRVALQEDPIASRQKIVVVGYVQGISNNQVTNSPNAYQLFVIRYNWDGSLDTTFNPKGTPGNSLFPKGFPPGIVLVSLPNNTSLNGNTVQQYTANNQAAPPLPSQGYALKVLDSGDIIVAGNSNGQLLVAWILSAGVLNSSFNRQGFIYNLNVAAQSAGAPISPQGVLLQANRVPLLGRPGIVTASLMSNVTRSNTGLAVVGSDCGYGIEELPNGSIVVVGFGTASQGVQQGYTALILCAFTKESVPDPTFGPRGNGVVITPLLKIDSRGYSITKQADGRLIVAGTVADQSKKYYVVVARYLPNGFLDPAFSGPSFPGITPLTGVQGALPPGVIYFPFYPTHYSPFARQDGTLLSYAFQVAIQVIQGIEKIVVGGYTQLSVGIPIAALNTHELTGLLQSGVLTVPLVTVAIINTFCAARINTNGTVDTSFNSLGPTPGQQIIPVRGYASFDDKAFDCAIDTVHKNIVLYGSSKDNSYNYWQDPNAQCYAFATVRLAFNGTVDGRFTNIVVNR